MTDKRAKRPEDQALDEWLVALAGIDLPAALQVAIRNWRATFEPVEEDDDA